MFEACVRVLKSYSLYHPNDDAVIISMSYLLILGRVSANISEPDVDGIQFGIWVVPSSKIVKRPRPPGCFQSALHSLDEGRGRSLSGASRRMSVIAPSPEDINRAPIGGCPRRRFGGRASCPAKIAAERAGAFWILKFGPVDGISRFRGDGHRQTVQNAGAREGFTHLSWQFRCSVPVPSLPLHGSSPWWW